MSISQDSRTSPPAGRKIDLDGFYEDRHKKQQQGEGRAMLKQRGVYVPTAWAKRWDDTVAKYLAYFVSYVGSQKNGKGWIWKSWVEVYDETGLTRGQQDRAKRILKEQDVLEVRHNSARGVSNVRVNLPLVRLWDEMDAEHGAAVEALDAAEDATGAVREAPRAAQSATGAATAATHIRNTSNTINTHQHQGREGPADPRLAKCLAVLEEMEMDEVSRRQVEAIMPDLLARYPALTDPVGTCRRYRDKVAGKAEPVRWHRQYLAGHFEREAAEVEKEPTNPHGAGSERFKDKPRRADWYAAVHGGAVEEYAQMIAGGLTHSEIEAATARKTARAS